MKHLFGVLAVLVALTAPTPASAGNSAAEQLFREGRRLAKEGKLAEACDAFERSDQLEPRVGALLNLAACRESQGRIATAYTLFLEARLRAFLTLERRADFASEHMTALEPLLPLLTLKVDPAHAVEGLVIKRGGVVVATATWNTPIAVDPAVYTIEVSAPNRAKWSVTQRLNPGDRIAIEIPLVAETTTSPRPTATPVPAPAVAAREPTPTTGAMTTTDTTIDTPVDTVPAPDVPVAKRRYFAVGAALGVSAGKLASARNDNPDILVNDHFPIGLRLVGSAPVPYGALRAIGSLLYTKGLNDDSDSTNTKKLYAFGLGIDYLYMPHPRLAFGVGAGFGWDHEVRPESSDTAPWTMLRASPVIVRLADGMVELGVHTQLIKRGDGLGYVGLAAVDVFLL